MTDQGPYPYFLTHDTVECHRAKKRMPPSYHLITVARPHPGGRGRQVLLKFHEDDFDQLVEDVGLLQATSRRLHRDNDRLLREAIGLGNKLVMIEEVADRRLGKWVEAVFARNQWRERAKGMAMAFGNSQDTALLRHRGWLLHRDIARMRGAGMSKAGRVLTARWLRADRLRHAP